MLFRSTQEIESGAFEWKLDLEDVHLNIEARLTQLVGDAGKRLHTGRSRNDQVATDVRLYCKDSIDRLSSDIAHLQRALVEACERSADAVVPGYTHLQRGQPVTAGHHFLAYVEMLERDKSRLADARKRLNISPLGSGALAGSTINLDRRAIAADGLACAGWVANCIEPGMPQLDENIAALEQRLESPMLGRIGFDRGRTPSDAALLLSIGPLLGPQGAAR